MSLSHRELGTHKFEYADYSVTVSARWVDHDYGHEKTPRYEVSARAYRIDGGACESFSTSAEAPLRREPNFLGRLFGVEPKEADLADLVEGACNRIRSQIDGMYADIGVDEAEADFQARVEAEAAVESWVEVDE